MDRLAYPMDHLYRATAPISPTKFTLLLAGSLPALVEFP
jgi:hypothetical protein